MADRQAEMTNAKPFYVQCIADLEHQLNESQAEVKRLQSAFDHRGELLDKANAELAEARKDAEWQRITPENLPPSHSKKWLGWNRAWGNHVFICHYYSEGECYGDWCEDLEKTCPTENPTHFLLINPPAQKEQSK